MFACCSCLGENTKEHIRFAVQIEKEVKIIDKNGEEITKNISYVFQFIVREQDLWKAHYQILSIIFLVEFVELNVNTNMILKNVTLVELNVSIAAVFLNIQTLKMI